MSRGVFHKVIQIFNRFPETVIVFDSMMKKIGTTRISSGCAI